MEIAKALGFVERRTGSRGTRFDRGMGGHRRVVASKMMRLDDMLHRHMRLCYALLAVGLLGMLL